MNMRNKAILPVTPIKQPKGECAPTCLAVVLSYFKKPVSIDDIIKTVPKDTPKWRDWLYWMGIFAIKQGLKAEIVTMSTQTFDVSWEKAKNQKVLLNKLRKEYSFVRSVIKSKKEPYPYYFLEHHPKVEIVELRGAIEFLKAGGIISVQPTTTELIEQRVKSGNPVIASLNASVLYRFPRGLPKDNDITGSTWGHVVVVNGFDGTTFSIVDPATWYRKSQMFKVKKEYLIESILRRDQNLLVVKK